MYHDMWTNIRSISVQSADNMEAFDCFSFDVKDVVCEFEFVVYYHPEISLIFDIWDSFLFSSVVVCCDVCAVCFI